MVLPKDGQPESIETRIVGIQGGLGSFNHQAADERLPSVGVPRYELRYFDSTAALFRSLRAGEIDFGQFAIFNSSAGFYAESLEAVSQNVFEVVANYRIPIVHCLIHHADSQPQELRTIITHKEVLKQCRSKLTLHYPLLNIEVGDGEFKEPASVAAAVAAGKLGRDVATVSCGRLAKEFGLVIGECGLQDSDNNESTFLLVRWFELTVKPWDR